MYRSISSPASLHAPYFERTSRFALEIKNSVSSRDRMSTAIFPAALYGATSMFQTTLGRKNRLFTRRGNREVQLNTGQSASRYLEITRDKDSTEKPERVYNIEHN